MGDSHTFACTQEPTPQKDNGVRGRGLRVVGQPALALQSPAGLCRKMYSLSTYYVVRGSVLSPGTGEGGFETTSTKSRLGYMGILETATAHTDSDPNEGFVYLGGKEKRNFLIKYSSQIGSSSH